MKTILLSIAAAAAMLATASARADAVTDWNTRATDLIAEARMGTPPAVRLMALVQTAVHDAVDKAAARPGAVSVDAAVAAATRGVLAKALPTHEATLNAAYQAALANVADGSAKAAGIDAGEKSAAAVLAARASDGAATPESYRPAAQAGAYVPTPTPAVPQWSQRKPWVLARPDQFRPGPPPALASAAWARDYNEIKAIGSRGSTQRTAEQTEIARFWEYSLPSIYFNVVRSIAVAPGRDVARNAQLYAAVAQAMDDAMIAVMDAKYHYNFWRPITAIRNGDQDGNDATERDAGWVSLIDSPLHPEYPSAHSILAAAVGTLLKADLAGAPAPVLSTVSPTLKGATRRWTSIDDFMNEVAAARVYEGIHYRHSTEVGLAMGRQVGTLVAAKQLALADEPPLAQVPARLQPAGEKLVMVVPARGVQVYQCRTKTGSADPEWTFVAPDAELFDQRGNRIGKHYAGPHWEAADGSKVVGAVKERADAPTAGAIPWLLLTTHSAGAAGAFSQVTSIQRVNTTGGLAPQSGCTQASLGKEARVSYTADYYFFAR